ncbi:carbohydrate kinase family protein [Paenibacillus alkalitolerans]|uniref:carbohydrate kinase family protein n=1 Tax=Paenibacillus alkalitolerans TaxID=2799335 RepID=UPI0018F3A1AB|nr:carbohydrate kinase family protein [Paenibacillus alkalitolerans]
MKTYDVVVFGDANIDLVVAGCNELPLPGQEVFVDNMTMHVGGGAALFALALAKLGLRVAFNGVLGGDGYAEFILDRFRQYGIDTRYIKTSSLHHTGISIAINPEKDRSFITYAGSNAELNVRELDMESVAAGRHVHLTGYKGSRNHDEFVGTIRTLKAKGATVSCDVGWDDTGEWYSGVFEVMGLADVFFMNETEALHYSGCRGMKESVRELARHGGHVVVKLGSKGAVALRGGELLYRSGYAVKAVDTTGAGDSFNAGYMYGYLTGKPVEFCLIYGNACGALSVEAYGGSAGTPDREALAAFVAGFDGTISDAWEAAL